MKTLLLLQLRCDRCCYAAATDAELAQCPECGGNVWLVEDADSVSEPDALLESETA